MKRVGAAAVVVNARGEILLVHHTYGPCNWELPGGGGEEGESPVDTAIREVKEETGLLVVARHLTGWYYEQSEQKEGLHVVFWCESQQGAQSVHPDGSEVSECRYWQPDALPRPMSDFTLLRIRDALAGAAYPLPTAIGPRQWLE